MGCLVDGKGLAAASSGNVALCNNTEKLMNSPCMMFCHIRAGNMPLVVQPVAGIDGGSRVGIGGCTAFK